MKKHIFLILAALIAAFLLISCGKRDYTADITDYAREEIVQCDAGEYWLTGTLVRPLIGDNVPIVLLFHGFTAGRDEYNDIFTELAYMLAGEGVASVRFDFGGTGDSGGRFDEMSLMTELADARVMLSYVKTLDFVDTENISVVGVSMGGAVASLLCEEYPGDISRMALWAPAASLVDDTRGGLYEWLMEDGSIKLWDGFELGRSFADDIEDIDYFGSLGSYAGDILLLYGELDSVMWGGYAELYEAAYPNNIRIEKLGGVGHKYRGRARETVLELTCEFLISNPN